MSPGYTTASETWPGLGKCVEECAELSVVLGKIITNHGRPVYYDGRELMDEAHEEVADVLASVIYFIKENDFDREFILRRMEDKLDKFYSWKQDNL